MGFFKISFFESNFKSKQLKSNIYKLNINMTTTHNPNPRPPFSQTILADVDAILYVDTDILFVDSLTSVFAHFTKFNSTQMVASASETDELSQKQSWYTRSAKHPYYQPLGLCLQAPGCMLPCP